MNQQEIIFASTEDQKIFVEALINPPAPNEKLKSAYKAYKKKMGYTKEENEAYQAAKAERNHIEREDRKNKKKGFLFHRSTKIGPTGKPVGVTFTGKCDETKVAKLAKRV